MKPALNESPQAVVFSGFIFSAGNSVKIPFCAAKVGFVPRVTIIMLFTTEMSLPAYRSISKPCRPIWIYSIPATRLEKAKKVRLSSGKREDLHILVPFISCLTRSFPSGKRQSLRLNSGNSSV